MAYKFANTYWNENGKYQAEYEEMEAAVDAGTFEFTKTTKNVFYHYYRFFNDGDVPTSYAYHKDDYQPVIEARVDKRIVAEYKKFIRRTK